MQAKHLGLGFTDGPSRIFLVFAMFAAMMVESEGISGDATRFHPNSFSLTMHVQAKIACNQIWNAAGNLHKVCMKKLAMFLSR
jgi:hypothetical protein